MINGLLFCYEPDQSSNIPSFSRVSIHLFLLAFSFYCHTEKNDGNTSNYSWRWESDQVPAHKIPGEGNLPSPSSTTCQMGGNSLHAFWIMD